jgi:hypothetical protein
LSFRFHLSFIFNLIGSIFLIAQNFGEFASAVFLKDCGGNLYYNTTGSGLNCINVNCATQFNGKNFGSFNANSSSFEIRGGEIKSWKNSNGNVCSARLNWVVYPQGNRPASPVFTTINLPFKTNCCGTTFCDGQGPCGGSDQKWGVELATGTDLTSRPAGNYSLEIYFDYSGGNTSGTCDITQYISNSGNNFIANFQIVATASDCSILLPLVFGEFNTICLEESEKIGFETLSEHQTDFFLVQAGNDAQHWENITQLKAAGESITTTNYHTIVNRNNYQFYRICLYNLDGSTSYFGPFSSSCSKNQIIKTEINIVYPNPGETLHLRISKPKTEEGECCIYDVSGLILMKVYVEKGKENITIPISEKLKPGFYPVMFFSNKSGETKMTKLVVPD